MTLLLFSACTLISDGAITDKVGTGDGGGDTGSPGATDADGDGYTVDEGDCDDADDAVYPGAEETWYDGVDSDCSGGSDYDRDGDGYDIDEECDDSDPGKYPSPGTDDPWYDGVDQDCDGNDGDQDGDGFCAAGYTGVPCRLGNDDCADDPAVSEPALNGFPDRAASDIYPGAGDTWYDDIDQDCAGNDDFDQDADGFRTGAYQDSAGQVGDDCDDTDSDVNPAAVDTWYDGTDADCSGGSDYDQDGDGYDSSEYGGEDCDDTASSVQPAATEDCATAHDDNCDGSDNNQDSLNCSIFYEDADGDGYGDAAAARCRCTAYGSESTDNTDCDDTDGAVNPGATEVCENGVDDDCDGTSSGCQPTSGSLSLAVEYPGEATGDQAGYSVAFLGDVNADGYDDLLVGAPANDDGGISAGSAYLILGSASPVTGSVNLGIQFTAAAYGSAGSRVSAAGDVDGDGFDDFLVSDFNSPSASFSVGAAILILGRASPTAAALSSMLEFSGEDSEDYAGIALAAAGDVDGDGYGDFLVGAVGSDRGTADAGAAYIVRGTPTIAAQSLGAATAFGGEEPGDEAGNAVAGGGDIDADGFDDCIVGAPTNDVAGDAAGVAYIILGDAALSSGLLADAVQLWGEEPGDRAGVAVAHAGDVNADGYADVAVGAYLNGDGGAAYLVWGGLAPASSDLATAVKFEAESSFDYAGLAVGGGGDVDADGYSDFVVGAYKEDARGGEAGAAYLILGSSVLSSAGLETTVKYEGEDDGDYAGYSVSVGGDFDADGFDDIAVGAANWSDGIEGAGAAYLVLGTGL